PLLAEELDRLFVPEKSQRTGKLFIRDDLQSAIQREKARVATEISAAGDAFVRHIVFFGCRLEGGRRWSRWFHRRSRSPPLCFLRLLDLRCRFGHFAVGAFWFDLKIRFRRRFRLRRLLLG